MASDLVSKMSEKWEPKKYRDDYRHALLEVIQEKVESGGKSIPVRGTAKKATNVVDLVSVLQQSLERAGRAGTGPKRKTSTSPKRRMRKAA
jgi:DNA end-binding protein Ku